MFRKLNVIISIIHTEVNFTEFILREVPPNLNIQIYVPFSRILAQKGHKARRCAVHLISYQTDRFFDRRVSSSVTRFEMFVYTIKPPYPRRQVS